MTDTNLSSENRIRNLLQKIKTNKKSREIYLELGVELVRINMIDQALLSFKQANLLEEDYLSLYNSASLYYKKNEYKAAILQLEKARNLNPEFVMIPILSGICYSRLNNFRAAEVNFIKVLMTDPSNRTALTALSILYHNQGRISESINIINKLTALYKPGEKISKLKTGLIKKSIDNKNHNLSNAAKDPAEKYREYDDYIKSLPVEIYTDKFGTINDKIEMLETKPDKNAENLISLSLCHLFSGNTDTALEYLYAAKNCKAS